MHRKKVVIKNKTSADPPSSKQRPRTKVGAIPEARVYNLSSPSELPVNSTFIVNNLVKLKLNLVDIKRLEDGLKNTSLLSNISDPVTVPSAWNDSAPTHTGTSLDQTVKMRSPFQSLIKHNNVINVVGTTEKAKPSRKDLIINSGIKRKTHDIMKIYNHGWPTHTSYACWYCCHKFNTTPVGIPQLLVHTDFYCYGNFCSYNCAKRYLRPLTEDDMAMLQTPNDVFVEDDLGEKLQLLELLYHIETNTPLDEPLKPAPRRLTLTMFGGNKTIEEFRKNFATHCSYHVFRSPLVPISYQMEECVDKTEKRRRKQHVSLDTIKIQRAFNELSEKAAKGKKLVRKYTDVLA